MPFKIGDYAIHINKQGAVVLHITTKREKIMINTLEIYYRHATEDEIEQYHAEKELN